MMKDQSLRISIIICTKGRVDDIKVVAKSLLTQTLLPFELIIVDGAKEKRIESEISSLIDGKFNFYYVSSELGLTLQRNIGIEQAKGEIVYFLDDDVKLEEHNLEEILKVYQAYPEAGGVTGLITNMPRSYLRNTIQRFFMLPYSFGKGQMQPSGHPAWNHFNQNLTQVEFMYGAGMSFSHKVFQNLSFDENLKGYAFMEDVDFSYRVSKKYPIYQTPKAKMEHYQSQVLRDKIRNLKIMTIKYHHYLFKKNMPQKLSNKLAYLWSSIGFLGISLIECFKQFSIMPIVGAGEGYLKLIMSKKFDE